MTTDILTSLISAYQQILSHIPLSPENLRETPKRASKALLYLTQGYSLTAEEAASGGIFDYSGTSTIHVYKMEIASLCQHHLLPFFGTCSITYIPDLKILGLSKLKRVINVFARRLQVQEVLTDQIADSIMKLIVPRGVRVEINCMHLCMSIRGVKNFNAKTRTVAHRGQIISPKL